MRTQLKLTNYETLANMRRLITILILFFTYSCTEPLDRKISEEDAYEYLNEICESIGKYKYMCQTLREKYALVLAAKESGSEGRAAIAREYGKTFEQLTFRDLRNN